MQYSQQQIDDWRKYERVRASGRFNMFDNNAVRMTGLTEDRYLFVLTHYDSLQTLAETENE